MPLSLDKIRAVAADAMAPRHFFAGNGLCLEWEHVSAEDIPWEIYKGRLLGASQTRERRTFEAWSVYGIDENGRSTEPLLSLRLDAETQQLHVVRAILCYAWEAYDAGNNVILSRETKKWVRELVGTIGPEVLRVGREHDTGTVGEFLRMEVICALFQAVIGTSRLPLTSIEAPLPSFSLGRLGYFYLINRAVAGPMRSWRELVDRIGSAMGAKHADTRLFEFFLRAVPTQDLAEAANAWMKRFTTHHRKMVLGTLTDVKPAILNQEARAADTKQAVQHLEAQAVDPDHAAREKLGSQLQTLFNDVSLTPFTDFVPKVLAFVEVLVMQGLLREEQVANFLGWLLRQLGRHLTAYDLVTFHHRGANYPDALLLDDVLKAYLRLIEGSPHLFLPANGDDVIVEKRKRLLRRALRQGWLLRRGYEGHLIPDEPTSPGENLRVLPPPHLRVPDEQIHNPAERKRRLYDGDSLDAYLGEQTRVVLRQSIEDLQDAGELRELGMATFLDHLFGNGKQPMESDGTPLLSYSAFSRTIAQQRLRQLVSGIGLVSDRTKQERFQRELDAIYVPGFPVREIPGLERPAIISLADVQRVADDFVLLQTCQARGIRQKIARSVRRFSLRFLWSREPILLLRGTSPGVERESIAIYDERFRLRLVLEFDSSKGYVKWRGTEFPASSLQVVRVWEDTENDAALRERDVSSDQIFC
jgi:hypothetical protein